MSSTKRVRCIDIGANLVDEMFKGIYNGSKKHEPDLDLVLQRAWNSGVEKIFITAGNLEEAKQAAQLVETKSRQEPKRLFSTIGVHPTRCSEFLSKTNDVPPQYIKDMKTLFDDRKSHIIALGEFGLDYERTQFCDIETQKRFFELQLTELGPYTNLPLFLHNRAAATDLHEILNRHRDCFTKGGVVHSFDGTEDELNLLLQLDLYIGINGCSLKTEANCNVVKSIPTESLLLETDSPWCGIRPSHFSSKYCKTKFEAAKKNWSESSMYKSRNEPQTIINVLEVVAALKEIPEEELAEIVYKNTEKLFFS